MSTSTPPQEEATATPGAQQQQQQQKEQPRPKVFSPKVSAKLGVLAHACLQATEELGANAVLTMMSHYHLCLECSRALRAGEKFEKTFAVLMGRTVDLYNKMVDAVGFFPELLKSSAPMNGDEAVESMETIRKRIMNTWKKCLVESRSVAVKGAMRKIAERPHVKAVEGAEAALSQYADFLDRSNPEKVFPHFEGKFPQGGVYDDPTKVSQLGRMFKANVPELNIVIEEESNDVEGDLNSNGGGSNEQRNIEAANDDGDNVNPGGGDLRKKSVRFDQTASGLSRSDTLDESTLKRQMTMNSSQSVFLSGEASFMGSFSMAKLTSHTKECPEIEEATREAVECHRKYLGYNKPEHPEVFMAYYGLGMIICDFSDQNVEKMKAALPQLVARARKGINSYEKEGSDGETFKKMLQNAKSTAPIQIFDRLSKLEENIRPWTAEVLKERALYLKGIGRKDYEPPEDPKEVERREAEKKKKEVEEEEKRLKRITEQHRKQEALERKNIEAEEKKEMGQLKTQELKEIRTLRDPDAIDEGQEESHPAQDDDEPHPHEATEQDEEDRGEEADEGEEDDGDDFGGNDKLEESGVFTPHETNDRIDPSQVKVLESFARALEEKMEHACVEGTHTAGIETIEIYKDTFNLGLGLANCLNAKSEIRLKAKKTMNHYFMLSSKILQMRKLGDDEKTLVDPVVRKLLKEVRKPLPRTVLKQLGTIFALESKHYGEFLVERAKYFKGPITAGGAYLIMHQESHRRGVEKEEHYWREEIEYHEESVQWQQLLNDETEGRSLVHIKIRMKMKDRAAVESYEADRRTKGIVEVENKQFQQLLDKAHRENVKIQANDRRSLEKDQAKARALIREEEASTYQRYYEIFRKKTAQILRRERIRRGAPLLYTARTKRVQREEETKMKKFVSGLENPEGGDHGKGGFNLNWNDTTYVDSAEKLPPTKRQMENFRKEEERRFSPRADRNSSPQRQTEHPMVKAKQSRPPKKQSEGGDTTPEGHETLILPGSNTAIKVLSYDKSASRSPPPATTSQEPKPDEDVAPPTFLLETKSFQHRKQKGKDDIGVGSGLPEKCIVRKFDEVYGSPDHTLGKKNPKGKDADTSLHHQHQRSPSPLRFSKGGGDLPALSPYSPTRRDHIRDTLAAKARERELQKKQSRSQSSMTMQEYSEMVSLPPSGQSSSVVPSPQPSPQSSPKNADSKYHQHRSFASGPSSPKNLGGGAHQQPSNHYHQLDPPQQHHHHQEHHGHHHHYPGLARAQSNLGYYSSSPPPQQQQHLHHHQTGGYSSSGGGHSADKLPVLADRRRQHHY